MATEFNKVDLRPDLEVVPKTDRINQTPNSDGEWKNILGISSKRGTGSFYPKDNKRIELLKKYETDHVNYDINAEPDFSPFAEAQIKIPNMEGGNAQSRAHNFSNANKRMLGTDWANARGLKSQADIQQYMKEHDLTWHEKSDGVTMQMVPSEINMSFGHVGGVSTIANIDTEEEGFRRAAHSIASTKVKVLQKVVEIEETIGDTINSANMFIDDAANRFLSEDLAEMNRAGMDEAMSSAMFAATLSVTKNVVAVIKDDKNMSEAAKDVLADTSASAVVGYATGVVMNTLQLPRGDASLLVNGTVQMSKQIVAFANGEIDEQQLATGIAETAAYLSVAYIGKTLGAAVGGAIAGEIGAEIGKYIGEMITTAVCSEVISTIKFSKEFEKQNLKMISLYHRAEAEIRESQARLKFIAERENNELISAIQEGFNEITEGIKSDSYAQVENGLAAIGSKFGLEKDDFSRNHVTRDTIFSNKEDVLVIG